MHKIEAIYECPICLGIKMSKLQVDSDIDLFLDHFCVLIS